MSTILVCVSGAGFPSPFLCVSCIRTLVWEFSSLTANLFAPHHLSYLFRLSRRLRDRAVNSLSPTRLGVPPKFSARMVLYPVGFL